MNWSATLTGSGVSARSATEIDLFKALDSLDWNFLVNLLKAVGFPSNFIGWIRGCPCCSRFSVSINGSLGGFFRGRKGVRQGDPLSS